MFNKQEKKQDKDNETGSKKRRSHRNVNYSGFRDAPFLILYLPEEDHPKSMALPKHLLRKTPAVYTMYSPSPHTETNRPFELW